MGSELLASPLLEHHIVLYCILHLLHLEVLQPPVDGGHQPVGAPEGYPYKVQSLDLLQQQAKVIALSNVSVAIAGLRSQPLEAHSLILYKV